ncbi:ribonuclease H-like domain-containing protein [Apiosordaria backusii]|uniref:Ribonuclease H-like domain-containing protein n=1 Tax=Apiosordaria backusii TaxID=314023 RepID=A0AA40DYT7_9PEZI|nr:ribonuclease H-like domain-containing protein [Apiosordaria backusii]
MESSQDFNSLRDAIQPALLAVTRSANGLANEDLQFQRTVHPSVGSQLDNTTDRMLQLVSGLLKSSSKVTGQSTSKLEDLDDVEIKWKGIVDVIDSFLEKADTCLDEYTGLIKRKDAPTFEAGRDAKRTKSTTERLDWSLKRANIVKPQNAFEKKPDNSNNGPWKPILTTKPHAIVPLDQCFTTFINEEQTTQYQHPYRHEIEAMQYPSHVFESREPIKYLPVETTKAIWVDTYEGVLEMLEELKKAREIAIDLEHHDYRTYTGLLSLMQISTREKDWIVDTLMPWRHKLEILNEVFADPKIVKVFHGAYMDIVWLQRDLGLYVVGLFDTHHASTVLGYGGGSLAFLLKKFVDFEADKKYQLADWRIRPLPDEMLYYARADTHYLLYIYDMIRNDLAATANTVHPDGKPIQRVIAKSKETSLRRHENPTFELETGYGDRGWYNYLARSSFVYNREEFAVFKALWNWRDTTARQEDESAGFIMNQNVIAEIVRIMPTDKKALWSLLDGHARHLKPRLDELFNVIQEAKEKGATGPTLLQYFSSTTSNPTHTQVILPKAAEPEVSVDINELKSEQSQLWGKVPLSSTWEPSSKKAPETEELLEIPLFYSVAQAEEDEDLPDASEPVPILKPASEVYGKQQEPENQEFTLKAGRKRKASEADVPSGPEQVESEEPEDNNSDVEMDDVVIILEDGEDNDEDEEEEGETDSEAAKKAAKQEKKLRRKAHKKAKRAAEQQTEEEEGGVDDEEARREAKRAERKARKAAKKAAKEQEKQLLLQEEGEGEEGEEEEAFDYSKAASVLRADGGAKSEFDNNKKRGKKGRKEKVFDPYAAKASSELKGVRNRNYERAGRSGTFKK